MGANLTGRTAPLPLLLLAVFVAAPGCSGEPSAQIPSARPASVDADVPAVLAEIGETPVTLDDIRARIGDRLDQMENVYRRERHKAIEGELQALLRERVLIAEAQAQGKSVEELIAAEAGGSLVPSDVEVAAWYQENPDRVGGRTLDQIRTQIAEFLAGQRREEAMQKLEARLNEERGVVVHFEPYRIEFDHAGAPSSGPDNAPVTLVEFSDFECPFCQRFAPTLSQLKQNYGDQLRVVYRQFPLTNIHPNAFKAAEASLCAHEQGKFWEMHDLLFQEQNRLAVRDLKQKAGRLGLNQAEFDRCMDSGRHVEQIQNDLAEGNRIGVNGTPALFVNGVPVDGGAVPYETVASMIDRELARK